MANLKFETVNEALSYVAEHTTAHGGLDESYGLFEVGTVCDIEDGTPLLIIDPPTVVIVVGGKTYGVEHRVMSLVDGKPTELASLFNPKDNRQRQWISFAKSVIDSARAENRKTAIKKQIAAAINSLSGEEKATISENNNLLINGAGLWDLTIHEDRSRNSGSYHSSGLTGTLSVIVGGYGNKRRFPQRKNGGHNYPEIASVLVESHRRAVVRESMHLQSTSNLPLAGALRAKYGYSTPWSINNTADADKPVRVERKLAFSGTPEQVEQYMVAVDKALAELAS